MTLPNRSHLLTEQRNPRTMNLHKLSVADLVRTIRREDETVLTAMATAEPALSAFLEEAEPRFIAGGRLIYLGAGTSGRLAVLDASEAPPTFDVPPGRVIGIIAGGDAALRTPVEGAEDNYNGAAPELNKLNLTSLDTVIAIAAGGTTPYALGALEHTKLTSPQTLRALITCTPLPPTDAPPDDAHSVPPWDSTDDPKTHLLLLPTGPEVITGSTRMKAGTATKRALNIISTTLMIRDGRVHENLMVELRATNDKLRDRAARIIATLTGLDRDASLRTLEEADGEVKTAIVMHKHQLDAETARQHLKTHNNRLEMALQRQPDAPTND